MTDTTPFHKDAKTLIPFTCLRYEMAEGVACITLNRPDCLNAFTVVMADELIGAIADAAGRDEIKALLVTGAGRAFCAGADLNDPDSIFVDRPSTGGEGDRDHAGRVVLALYEFPKPVIGLINGAAVGVGITMTLPMDYRIATDHARMGFVFSRRGISPEGCSSWFLPRLVGITTALRWCYTGDLISSGDAVAAGLINEVVEDNLIAAGLRVARELTANSSAVSIAVIRQLMWRMMAAEHPMSAHRVESKILLEMGALPDAREGVAAFLDKRPPAFTASVVNDMPASYPWWDQPTFK